MGRAKEKLFGKKRSKWPFLMHLVEKNILLSIDLSYAQEKGAQNESEAAHYALLFAANRKGHLALPPTLSDFTTDETLQEKWRALLSPNHPSALPKNTLLEKELVAQLKRIETHFFLKLPFTRDPTLTLEQNSAIENALHHPLSLITGGPGTGKTHTATKIVEAYLTAQKKQILIAAPTGKAAAHLAAKLPDHLTTSTLHSLLDLRTPLAEVTPIHADLIIVDESSMISPELFVRLLSSLSDQTRLVLMGDANQLPAVEGGSIFADLMDLSVPTTRLTKCHRSDRLEILSVAENILKGRPFPLTNLDLGFTSNDKGQILENIWAHTKKLFPDNWLESPNRFQILTTLRKGPLGVEALNAFFAEKFTTQHPIIITRNDQKTGLSNGDTGVLLQGKEAVFPNGMVLPVRELPPYEYAYALSVHKSQGSEYDHVLFLVPEGSEVFGREVLYTAVTRAKNRLEIAGMQEKIDEALQRSSRKTSNLLSQYQSA